ncbi:MAG: CocE/NonD family hydrolase [Acidimicrobiales bacterium]
MKTRRIATLVAAAGVLVAFSVVAPPPTRANATGAAARRSGGFVPPPPAKVTSSSPGATGKGFHATIEHFVVHTGPKRATTCSIIGELFVPDRAKNDPAILTTNGFGGSYTDQVALAEMATRYGYVVLSYSGLGFGGSGCNIELDSPTWDGEAASQLISYLGTLREVKRDGRDSPVVGMIGGSYGGEVQFATASIDPRVKAIVPIITWNDLAYSLAPNNTTASLDWAHAAPGVLKWEWTSLFFGEGLSEPFSNPTVTPFPPSTCPGFDPAICKAFLESVANGYPTPDVVSILQADSLMSYYKKVHIPTMLMQGENDSLFNIAEAIANYRMLKSVGDPVKLVLQSWGHSHLTPAPGELSYTSPAKGYETVLVLDWFARYLKGEHVSTGPAVEYFRPWVKYSPKGSAEVAYGTAKSWPVGSTLDLYLSSNGSLVRTRQGVVPGSAQFLNPLNAEPASYSETSGVQDTAPFDSIPPSDPPGTFASFETARLPVAVDSVGIPVLHVSISGATSSSVSPATEAVVFAKIYDVSPSGTVTLVNRLVAPARLSGTAGQATLTLPGVVHRYAKGDRIELVLAATDQAYIGDRLPDLLTVKITSGAPFKDMLQLPVVAPSNETSGGPRASSLGG